MSRRRLERPNLRVFSTGHQENQADEIERLREAALKVAHAHAAVIQGVTPNHENWCAHDVEETSRRSTAWHMACYELREVLKDA